MARRAVKVVIAATLMFLLVTPMAMAKLIDVKSGQGINSPGGPNPVDPTQPIAPNCAGTICIGGGATSGGGNGLFVQIGPENTPGRIGRVAASVGDGVHLLKIYEEQYIPGNPVHGVLETVNALTGCVLKFNKACTPNHDDAGLITIG